MIKELSNFLRASPALQVKLAGATGTIEGMASLFGGEPDSYGDIIARNAFSASLAQHRAEKTLPLMLWSHDPASPIGRWLEVVEDSKGLAVRGQLNLETERGREAHAHLKAGDVSGLSIGYAVPPGGRVMNDDGTSTLTEITLMEVSVVAMPAARRARVTGVKNVTSMADVERILRDSGLPRGAAVKLAAGGWPALLGHDEEIDAEKLVRTVENAVREIKGI
jgi:HK97 family phage prohead protease